MQSIGQRQSETPDMQDSMGAWVTEADSGRNRPLHLSLFWDEGLEETTVKARRGSWDTGVSFWGYFCRA